MANDESILREVEQELAEDRQSEMFSKYGPMLIGAGAAIVIGVAGWQFWHARADATAKSQALEFNAAVELLAEDQEAGRAALGAVAETGGGYGVLADLQRAASFARGGERLSAVELYRAIYANGAAARQIRDYARLRAGYLSLADGRDAVLSDLGGLADGEGLYSLYAREITALAALGAEDYETAQSMFRQLSVDIAAPAPLRTRAEDFAALAAAGKAGVNITGDARVEDLVRAIGEATPEAPVDDADAVSEAAPTASDAASESDAPEAGASEPESAAPNAVASEDDAPESASPSPDDSETN